MNLFVRHWRGFWLAATAVGAVFILGCGDTGAVAEHEPEAAMYAVTVSSAGVGAFGSGNYAEGATVAIRAGRAPDGRTFKNWAAAGGGVTFADPGNAWTAFAMPTKAVTVTAVFEPQSATPPGGGFDLNDIEMLPIDGGTFTMGCDAEGYDTLDCYDREKPAHSVTVGDFSIGAYEVTQGLWLAVMGSLPASASSAYGMGDDYPVYNVSWNSVQVFIDSLNRNSGKNYRLPTEAEWEYAARGGALSEGYRYSGSKVIGNVAWYSGNNDSARGADYGAKPVGGKEPNELGLYDMSGNVWEWVSDRLDGYGFGDRADPSGPPSGPYRVYRGGGWFYGEKYCRVSYRGYGYPGISYFGVGFRLALAP
jgi:formylglycine-generating enzyme required for sulfatase activity